MLTFRNFMIGLLLIFAISLSTWSILVSNEHHLLHASQDVHAPDAFMENVVATLFNKQGTPSLKLIAPKMVHYASDDTTQIDHPTVTIYRNSPNPWLIHSVYAKATQGISQILFWENVVISHLADDANPATTMQTAALTVFPDKKTAATNQSIMITQPDSTVQAIGMLADMNDGTVKLLSQAKGEYVPAS